MTMTDPIADMLTRLRNANSAYHDTVSMPSSKLKVNIAEMLKSEGYIAGYEVTGAEGGKTLGDVVGSHTDFIDDLVKLQMQGAETRALDVPVRLLAQQTEVGQIDEGLLKRLLDDGRKLLVGHIRSLSASTRFAPAS